MQKTETNMDIQKTQMIEALEKSLGVVTTAVKMVGISRGQHYTWIKNDPEYKAKVEDVQGIALDFVESKLYNLINAENPTAIIFYLKTKGKSRGYIERIDNYIKTDEDKSVKIEIISNKIDESHEGLRAVI